MVHEPHLSPNPLICMGNDAADRRMYIMESAILYLERDIQTPPPPVQSGWGVGVGFASTHGYLHKSEATRLLGSCRMTDGAMVERVARASFK